MANFLQVFSSFLSGKAGIKTETWSFRDKQGSSIFGDAKVLDMGVEHNGTVVSVPIEEGSFTSYNKTGEPIKISNTLAFQGTAQYLQSTLNLLKKYRESMDKFSIVTPYCEYEDMTLESFSYTRDVTNGEGLLIVKIECVEIKEVSVAYSSTDVSELPPPISEGEASNPSDSSTVDTGMTSTGTTNSSNGESAQRSRSILKDIFS